MDITTRFDRIIDTNPENLTLVTLQRWVIEAERLLAKLSARSDLDAVWLKSLLVAELAKKRNALARRWV